MDDVSELSPCAKTNYDIYIYIYTYIRACVADVKAYMNEPESNVSRKHLYLCNERVCTYIYVSTYIYIHTHINT